MRRTRLASWKAMSNTGTRGSPLLNGVQLAPPSVEAKTPMSVPATRFCVLAPSMAKDSTGTSGMPLPAATQVGAPEVRLVVFHTCCPAGTP
jgi:hypothetical protein